MENVSGLCVIGVVKDRRRREIIKNDEHLEIVSYEIIDNDNRSYYVEAFAPSSHFERGASIQIPVYVKPYIKKNGDPSYTLNLKSDNPVKNSRGESF